MDFYVFEREHNNVHYVLLQNRPIDGWEPALVFPAAGWSGAIDTVNTRVALRQNAEFYAPPDTIRVTHDYQYGGWVRTTDVESHPGRWRCRKCRGWIGPIVRDKANLRLWWARDAVCEVTIVAA